MRKQLLRIISCGFLSVILIASPAIIFAKDKSGANTGSQETLSWLDADEIGDLLSIGAFWCMDPKEDSCSFNSLVSKSETPDFGYFVTGLWDQQTIIREYYDAYIRQDSQLCEPSILNFKRIKWTDLEGNPVSEALRDEYRAELSEWYEQQDSSDRCFRYAASQGYEPGMFIQYSVDQDGNNVDPIEFLVDYSATAETSYQLRWE